VEASRSIDVSRLQKAGCLRPGWSGGWQWTRDGETVASINLRTEADCVHLSYTVQVDGGPWENVVEVVRIARVPCRFGGSRPYFICPGVVDGIACGRRMAKLYCAGRYFLCRHCYRLAHASQSEDAGQRALRRASKIRERLGGKPDTDAPFPEKPPGMRRSTYERLQNQAFDDEITGGDALTDKAMRLLARLNQPSKRKFW